MRNKTRKFIWSAPLVAALAIIGALTLAGVLLLPNADNAGAQDSFVTDPAAATISAVTPGNGQATVAMSAEATNPGVPEYTGFKVRYKLTSADDTAWTETAYFRANRDGSGATVVTGLTNGSGYDFQAALALPADMGPWSTTTAGTPVATVPGVPTDVEVEQTGIGEVRISWNAPSNNGGRPITGYTVATTGGGTITQPTGAATSATATGVADTDTFTVLATNSVGDGAASAPVAASINASPPITSLNFGGMVTDIDSTSGGAGVNITVEIEDLPVDLPVGSSIVLFLEDDYQVPSSIPASAVQLTATGTFSATAEREAQFSRGTVIAAASPIIKTGAYVDADKKDHAIQRAPSPTSAPTVASCGLVTDGQDLTMKLTSACGHQEPQRSGHPQHLR